MTPDDLDSVAHAEARIYPFPWTHGNFADSLKAGHRAIVAREQGVLVGYAVVMQALDEAHLLNISILPEAQSGGRGQTLLEHLLEDAKKHAAARMFLEVRRSNGRAQAFYLRHGFTEVAKRRSYYPANGGREDAIVMAREL